MRFFYVARPALPEQPLVNQASDMPGPSPTASIPGAVSGKEALAGWLYILPHIFSFYLFGVLPARGNKQESASNIDQLV